MRWTERRIYILMAVLTVVFAAVFGSLSFWVGYDIARRPTAPLQIIFQPGAIVVTAAPPSPPTE